MRNVATHRARMVLLGFSLALGGCSSIRVRLGQKVYLDKLSIASMEASLSGDPGIAPGKRADLLVTVTQLDGTILATRGKGLGKVLWSDLALTSSVVAASKKGVLSMPFDPRVTEGKMGHVTVTIPSHPGLRADLDVPLRYDEAFSADYSGSDGLNGSDGADGSDGTIGSMGSFDPDHPSAGGNGSDGGNGTNGGNGGDGNSGAPVKVRMTLRPGNHPLLEFGVSVPGRSEIFYLVDPQGGSLHVVSNGGSGGRGGRGGRAGRAELACRVGRAAGMARRDRTDGTASTGARAASRSRTIRRRSRFSPCCG